VVDAWGRVPTGGPGSLGSAGLGVGSIMTARCSQKMTMYGELADREINFVGSAGRGWRLARSMTCAPLSSLTLGRVSACVLSNACCGVVRTTLFAGGSAWGVNGVQGAGVRSGCLRRISHPLRREPVRTLERACVCDVGLVLWEVC
jgi:hypothetical protein